MDNVIENLKHSDRYKDFIFLQEARAFCELFAGKNYPVVQIHDCTPIAYGDGIIGFAGACQWKNNELIALDGDSYTEHMPVYGYHEFESEGKICLDVLTDDW